MLGRGQPLLEGVRGARENADGGVDVDGRVSDAVELHLLIHDLLAVFSEEKLAADAEILDRFRRLLRRRR